MASSDYSKDNRKLQSVMNEKSMKATGGGYSHNFVDKVDDFECTICLLVARDPKLIVKCGHSYCGICLDAWIRSSDGPLLCPSDKSEFKETDVFPDKRLGRMIQNLQVHCDNVVKGCSEKMELRNLQEHLEVCKFEMNYDISQEKLCEIVYKLEKRRAEDRELIEELRSENDKLKGTVNQLQTNVNYTMETIENLTKEIKDFKINILPAITMPLQAAYFNCTPCKWTISVSKTSTERWSPVFQTKGGYGMIIWIGIRHHNLNPKMTIECYLTSQDNDHNLVWPWDEEYTVIVSNAKTDAEIMRCQERGPGSPGRDRSPPDTRNDYSIFDGSIFDVKTFGDAVININIIVKGKF